MQRRPAGEPRGSRPARIVVLVTGASAGLGARFARVLNQAGAHVLATARRPDRLDELAGECGERIETIPGDITDARRRQVLAARLKPYGRLDVLVNNAGICDDGPIDVLPICEFGVRVSATRR